MITANKYIIMLLIFSLNLIICSELLAVNIYVDPTIGSNCTSGNYSITNRNCSGSDGYAYTTIQAAVNAMSGGDDIYIRGGTYTEYATLTSADNGTSENWSSIQSYPGEWAIIDAQAAEHYCLGHNNYDKTRGASMLEYWKFERLEFTGGDDSGLFVTGGPFEVRYCYFHDNLAPDGGANPCAIKGMIWKDSVVEYCWFKNNGCSGSSNEMHSAIGMQIHSDYVYSDPDVGPAAIANAYQNNIYRYNLFENTENRARSGIHDKALQTLTPNNTIDWTYKEYGNEIHHNVFIGVEIAIGSQQCFAQIHNNIVWNSKSGIVNADSGNGRAANAQTIYNNTTYVGRLMAHFGQAAYPGWKNPYLYWYNNIIDSPPADTGEWFDMTLGTYSMENPYTYYSARTSINNNYIYRPDNSTDIKVAREGTTSIESFDSTYGFINYSKASSEGSDNLYQGSSGASKYKTREAHVISDSTIVGNGGIGGDHPYLSGVTIPSYIGATNPNDDDWVDGVLGLANVTTLINGGPGDPAWIEGGGLPEGVPGPPPSLGEKN